MATTFRKMDDGGSLVLRDGDRIGFVRQIARGKWAATDTYFVAIRGFKKTRALAVKALVGRATLASHTKEAAR